jgi:predicted CoA-binding protein
MASRHEAFWQHASFALVGHSARKGFPTLTYRGLRQQGKKVFPVDPSVTEIEGDATYPDLKALPEKVEAAVLEVPREETADWVGRVADAGIERIWIHMNRDTPEALALAEERGLEVHSGTCAVMYVTPSPTYHSIHKWISKLMRTY